MRDRRKTNENEPLDPIAMTLAVWLGMIVCMTGLIRLSESAAEQAAIAQAAQSAGDPATGGTEVRSFNPRLIASGG